MQRFPAFLSELQIDSNFQRSSAKHPSALLMVKSLKRQPQDLKGWHRTLEPREEKLSLYLLMIGGWDRAYDDPRIFASVGNFLQHSVWLCCQLLLLCLMMFSGHRIYYFHHHGRSEVPPTLPWLSTKDPWELMDKYPSSLTSGVE